MDRNGDRPTANALAQHLEFVRALARRLVAGAEAEDIAQEALLTGATRGPDEPGALRPWLGRVVRNLVFERARRARRRAWREAIAEEARERPLSPDDLLVRARTHHALASLVLALDEPNRSVVLLRYYEGRSSAEIARRLNLPAGTVRWRLARALAELRRELDERSGGDRRAWAIALFPAAKRRPLTVLAGGLIMKASLKTIAIGLALLLALFTGRAILHGQAAARQEGSSRSMLARLFSDRPIRWPRAHPAPLPRWFAQPGVPPGRVAGRVVAGDRPVAGATVELLNARTAAGVPPLRRTTDAKGQFDFGLQRPALQSVVASKEGFTAAIANAELANPHAVPRPDGLVLRLGDCGAPLTGMVSDASGGPIVGAHICQRQGYPFGCATSDRQGRYRLCGRRDEGNLIVVEASGYGSFTDTIEGHHGPLHRDYLLSPEAQVSGQVVRAQDGTPVAGAWVQLAPALDQGHGPDQAATLTDEQGRFSLAGLSGGHYQLDAIADGGAPDRPLDLDLGAGGSTSGVILRVSATTTLRGVVLANGQPVAGVRLTAFSTVFPERYSQNAVTQPDGTFAILGAARGPNRLRLYGYQVISPKRIVAAGAEVNQLRVETSPTTVVRGRVLQAGQPVADATVASDWHVATSDESGRFELVGLGPGRHVLHAEGAGARGQAAVELESGEIVSLDLSLDAAASISGVVIEDTGQPAAGVSVTFFDLHGDDLDEALTSDDGSFMVTGLRGGTTYRPRVGLGNLQPGHLAAAAGSPFPDVTLASGASHAVHIKLVVHRDRGTIAGRVLDASGAPCPDVTVSAVRLDGDGPGIFRDAYEYPRAVTGMDGAFSIGELAGQRYDLKAQAGQGIEADARPIATGATGVTLRLPETGTLAGTLVGFDRAPQVIATQVLADRYARPLDVLTSGDRFTLTGLQPGLYQVATLDGQAEALTAQVTGGATTQVTLTRQGSATVRGRVRDFRTGEPVGGLYCQALLGVSIPRPVLHLADGVTTGDDGTFELTVPTGRTGVECYADGGETSGGAALVTLAAGEAADVEVWVVRLQSGGFVSGGVPGYLGLHTVRSLFGFTLASVVAKGPAEKAGLRAGDRVISVEGRAVDRLTRDGILYLIEDRPIGTMVPLAIARGARTFTTELRLGTFVESR